jgi:hypothetical protein
LVAASNTVAIFVTKNLQVETFAVHFEAFGLFTVAAHLLDLFYLHELFSPLSFFINVHSSESGNGRFILWWYKYVISGNFSGGLSFGSKAKRVMTWG